MFFSQSITLHYRRRTKPLKRWLIMYDRYSFDKIKNTPSLWPEIHHSITLKLIHTSYDWSNLIFEGYLSLDTNYLEKIFEEYHIFVQKLLLTPCEPTLVDYFLPKCANNERFLKKIIFLKRLPNLVFYPIDNNRQFCCTALTFGLPATPG